MDKNKKKVKVTEFTADGKLMKQNIKDKNITVKKLYKLKSFKEIEKLILKD